MGKKLREHLHEDTFNDIVQLLAVDERMGYRMDVATAVFEMKDGVPRLKHFTLAAPSFEECISDDYHENDALCPSLVFEDPINRTNVIIP